MNLNFKIKFHYILSVVLISLLHSNYVHSQKLNIEVKSFDQLMRDTLATQDAVFEAEKKILSQKQTKKVVEGDYIPSVTSEILGEYLLFDNFRELRMHKDS